MQDFRIVPAIELSVQTILSILLLFNLAIALVYFTSQDIFISSQTLAPLLACGLTLVLYRRLMVTRLMKVSLQAINGLQAYLPEEIKLNKSTRHFCAINNRLYNQPTAHLCSSQHDNRP